MITKLGVPSINAAGDMAFTVGYKSPTGAVSAVCKVKDFQLTTRTATMRVQTGQPLPGAGVVDERMLPADATFAAFLDPVLGSDGSILVLATIKGTGVTDANNKVLLFGGVRVEPGEFSVVARTGHAMAALGGAKIKACKSTETCGNGCVAFTATLGRSSRATASRCSSRTRIRGTRRHSSGR